MGTKFPAILAGVIFSVFSMAIISEARTMETDGLNEKQQKIVAISAFTAKGDLNNLNIALNEGLDAGLTVSEIKEILVQMYAYAGFPRSLNALGATKASDEPETAIWHILRLQQQLSKH
jgi:alkylhydroperoxidase/carboxymuconolactone decarboxylase family protein YurZ